MARILDLVLGIVFSGGGFGGVVVPGRVGGGVEGDSGLALVFLVSFGVHIGDASWKLGCLRHRLDSSIIGH